MEAIRKERKGLNLAYTISSTKIAMDSNTRRKVIVGLRLSKKYKEISRLRIFSGYQFWFKLEDSLKSVKAGLRLSWEVFSLFHPPFLNEIPFVFQPEEIQTCRKILDKLGEKRFIPNILQESLT